MFVLEESYIKKYFTYADLKSYVPLSKRHAAWQKFQQIISSHHTFIQTCAKRQITSVKLRKKSDPKYEHHFLEDNQVNILFWNGTLISPHSSSINILATFPGEPWYIDSNFDWNENLESNTDILELLNQATAIAGVSVLITQNCSLLITYIHTSNLDNHILNYRNNIKVAPGITCQITERYIDLSSNSAMNIVSHVIVAKKAFCSFCSKEDIHNKNLIVSSHFYFYIYEESKLDIVFLPQSFLYYQLGINVNICEPKASTTLSGLSITPFQYQHYIQTQIHHLASDTDSDLEWRSIGLTQSITQLLCQGLIASDLNNVTISQYHRHLQLNQDAKVISKPILEINSPNVIACHGSTIGSPREEEELYMQTRGISPEAMNFLFAESFGFLMIQRYNMNSERDKIAYLNLISAALLSIMSF